MEVNNTPIESSNERLVGVGGQVPPHRRRKSLWLRIALAMVCFILSLAVAEIAARYLLPPVSPLRFQQVQESLNQTLETQYGFGQLDYDGQQVRSLAFHDIFRRDSELFWKFAPNVRLPDNHWPMFGLISNGRGLREDHEIPLKKQPGEIRILFVGDSCTFGLLLHHTETVCHYTEEQLGAIFPDLKIEAINAGVPAYSLYQGWRFLETEGMGYQPDVVVLNFGWNDAGVWDNQSDIEHDRQWNASQPPGPLRHSRLCQMLWGIMHPAVQKKDPNRRHRPRLLPREYRDLLGNVAEMTKQHGVDWLLLVGAGSFNIDPKVDRTQRTAYQVAAYRYGRSIQFGPDGDAGFIDAVAIVQAMAATTPASGIFHDHIHPTALTNRQIAKALVEKLHPWLDARMKREQ